MCGSMPLLRSGHRSHGEDLPKRVSFGAGGGGKRGEERSVGLVAGEQVVLAVVDAGRRRLEGVEHAGHLGRQAFSRRRPGDTRDVGQPVQVPSLGRSRRNTRATASSTCTLALIGRPCSSHVYQVTPTPASWATSSRRKPGVRLRTPGAMPTCSGVTRSRRLRRKDASSPRRSLSKFPLSTVMSQSSGTDNVRAR